MIKLLQWSLLFLVNYNTLVAQQIDSTMSIYADQFVSEKVHLQIDRSAYKKGETIYYKAYLLEDQNLSSVSKNIYIDWYDDTGKILQQTEAPLLLSGSKGSFEVPQNYKGKFVSLKAYTKWMLNFDTALIYGRAIPIHQPNIKREEANRDMAQVSNSIQVQLYPEGGFAIAGLTNRFAFKAVDQSGHPVYIKGVVKNSAGQLLDSVTTIHDGMGSFSLLTQGGHSYFFNWIDSWGKVGIAEIKAQKQSGACLRVTPVNKKAFISIERTANAGGEFKTMHLLIHKNQFLRYKLDINMSLKTTINSEISLADLPTGIIQFTLFTADWIPACERIVFINNQNHSFYPQITVTKKDLSKKGKNQVVINVPDTLLTNMSMAVTDASLADLGQATIFSDFLLTDEIRGQVNNPGYYFSKEAKYNVGSDQSQLQDEQADSVLSAHLDLVMLTQGYRRFDWEKIVKGELPDILYPAETDYLQIKGNIVTKRPVKEKDQLSINVIVKTKDSAKSVLVLPIKSDGSFKQNPFFYYDTAQVYYSFNNDKNLDRNFSIKFENGLMPFANRKQFFSNQRLLNGETVEYFKTRDVNDSKSQIDSFFAQQDRLVKLMASSTLKEVIVRAKVRPRKQILDDYYTRGFYSGESNSYAVDVEGDIHSSGYLNIFSYLETKIPGFRVELTPPSFEPTPFWFADAKGMPGIPALLLDEAPISLSAMQSVSISSIAYVKAFRPPFLGSLLNGMTGVIALYSKKGYSPIQEKENAVGLDMALLSGYTKFKELIQPNYTDSKIREEADWRPTLYWNPFIITDKNNRSTTIEFYNNDISKKLYVVLEGLNTEGKMTRVVKLLE